MWRFGLGGILKILPTGIRNILPRESPAPDIDWENTKVYGMGANINTAFFINLKGDKPFGAVEKGEEYERLKEFLTRKIYVLKDPISKEQIVEEVYYREEIYSGELTSKAPDIIFSLKEVPSDQDKSLKRSLLFSNHRKKGILIARGPNIQQGIELQDAAIIDLAPTILFALGVPISKDMDGKVLKDIFKPSFLDDNTVEYDKMQNHIEEERTGLSEEEEEEIKDRLRELGYIG
jgi:predicted AlkP superfamily phosphohydrolase/phosphomutase